LSRNKKTGASKHYGYIEFGSKDVAKIVADTMNGYLIYSHLLKCEVMEEVHPNLFKGAGRKFAARPWNKMEQERHNKVKTPVQVEKVVQRKTLKQKKKQQALAAMGIDFDFPEPKRVKIGGETEVLVE
jgi:nucleolar protein 15